MFWSLTTIVVLCFLSAKERSKEKGSEGENFLLTRSGGHIHPVGEPHVRASHDKQAVNMSHGLTFKLVPSRC